MPARNSARSSCLRSCPATVRVNAYWSGSSSAHAAATASRNSVRSVPGWSVRRLRRSDPPLEDVVHQRGRCGELGGFGHPERLDPASDAFEDPQHRRLPGRTGEVRADPWVGVERVEHAEREGADRLLRRRVGVVAGDGGGDDSVGGGSEEFGLTRDVPVDRPWAGREALGQCAERETTLAHRVEEFDGSADDALPESGSCRRSGRRVLLAMPPF